MRQLFILILVLVTMACHNGGKSQISNVQDSTKIVALSKKTFMELVDAVPITELPFGVLGIDTIWTYPANTGLPRLPYDSLNVYGLNNYFQEHPETFDILTDDGEIAIYDIREIPSEKDKYVDFYFVARLPPYEGLESLIYYFQEIADKEGKTKYYDKWVWLSCQKDGKVKYASIISFHTWDNGGVVIELCQIKKDYERIKRYYCSPRSDVFLFYDTGHPSGEMDDEYDTPNRLILTRISQKDKDSKYIWINNTPIEYKTNDTPDDVRNRYNTLMESRKAK